MMDDGYVLRLSCTDNSSTVSVNINHDVTLERNSNQDTYLNLIFTKFFVSDSLRTQGWNSENGKVC